MPRSRAPFAIPSAVDAAIRAEAERTYPDECCGILLWSAGEPASLTARPFPNEQGRLHAADPVTWPRDARTAYQLDALRLQRVLDAAAGAGQTLAALFHSHPDRDAYFSERDRAAAAPFGAPTHPEAAQLVYAVRDGVAVGSAAFRWDGAAGAYVDIELQVLDAT